MKNNGTTDVRQDCLVLQTPEFRCPVTGMEFVFVKGGRYLMGNSMNNGFQGETPVREVSVDDFYLGRFPVTQLQWLRVMGYNPANCGTSEQCPVDSISHDMALEFVAQMNLLFQDYGVLFRLPTEAEWEYAARNGGKQDCLPVDFDFGRTAWYCANSGADTHPVGEKEPNELGLYDMAGNVWEWCSDWYAGDAYQHPAGQYQFSEADDGMRVLRGGSWQSVETCLRSTFRGHDAPMNNQWQYGLRVAGSLMEHPCSS